MFPELFQIPFLNFTVHSYGLMLVLGLFCAMELAKFLARRSGLNPDHFATAAILALVFGLVGARIAYVIQFHDDPDFNTGSVGTNLWNMINLTSGGLVYYGGFLFAFAGLVTWAIWKKIPLFRGMDIIAPCLMIGLAFGRVGCFLNGCCWGQVCDADQLAAVQFPYYSPPYLDHYKTHPDKLTPDPRLFARDPLRQTERLMTPEEIQKQRDLASIAASERSLPVINTQLISTITASLIAIVSYFVFTLYITPGRGFAVMMICEGASRTLIEGLRVEPTELSLWNTGLTLSQVIGIGVFVGGIALWFVVGKLRNTPRFGDRPGYPEATAPDARPATA
jgi:phosphatidylglycerol:prolipoprotein diacylglycerol transferase